MPADGNCTATLGHLDPTDRGEYHPCKVAALQTCQAGDLAGKHGNITDTELVTSYQELYLSTTPGSPYFFGDKSVVVHTSNTTRLTCANFVLVQGNGTAVGDGRGDACTECVYGCCWERWCECFAGGTGCCCLCDAFVGIKGEKGILDGVFLVM